MTRNTASLLQRKLQSNQRRCSTCLTVAGWPIREHQKQCFPQSEHFDGETYLQTGKTPSFRTENTRQSGSGERFLMF